MKYKLFIDSTSDLPKEVIEKYNINVIPLSVIFGEEEFFDLTPDEFYERLEKSEELPTTSQIPPQTFVSAFKKELDLGNKVICVTLGSNASGTFQSASIAKETLGTEDVILIDSNALCLGMGMVVINIARMLEKEEPIEVILDWVEIYTKNKIEHLFSVDTLKYLKKGGRIKASKAVIAEVLNIKPILIVEDAITMPFGKVRGRNKVIHYYIEHMKTNMDKDQTDIILVGHSQDRPFAEKMVEAIRSELGYDKEIIIGEIGSIIGVHTGPGVLAVFYIKK